jgi:hypothetical protein
MNQSQPSSNQENSLLIKATRNQKPKPELRELKMLLRTQKELKKEAFNYETNPDP